MDLLNSGTFKSEYRKHQIEDNHSRFLVLPVITGIIGLLFLSRNTYLYWNTGSNETIDRYFWLWSVLTLLSVLFRVLFSAINKRNNLYLLDKSMMLYATLMCCIAASVTALDSVHSSDFTAYTFTILGMATAYRASVSKYILITLATFIYFNILYFNYLEQTFSATFLLPIVVLNVISIFIAVSLERNRKKMVRLSLKLEATNKKLMEESIRDPLTKLYNRRYLTDYLMREVKEFSRSRESFCVAVCDLDHFKKINDKLGHLVGDQALESFAGVLKSVSRETDIHIRFGGEEFVIVMPRTNLEQAKLSMERLRQATEDYKFKDIPWSQTISVGLTEINELDDYDSLLARADRFVYKAKDSGRNTIVIE